MARYSLPRPDKEALGDHYTNKAGILAFILGTGVFNFRTAMGKNEARIFLHDNFTQKQMRSIFGRPWQDPTKVEMIEFIINLSQLATLVVEVGEDDKSSPFGMNSQELYDLLALDLFALPSSNEDDGEDVGEDVGEDAEISSVVQEVRDLCESHKDNYHVPGCCRNVLRNIIVFCGYVAEMHMIDYVKYHPHVLENKTRIMPSATSPRAEDEDHWNERCIWNKMFLHYSGATISRRNDARESEGEGMEEADGEGKAEEE